ncbi:hypothetical protein CBR_g41544 [Chara braunii]|uniref:Uncharacterized protein n=1 Tax=Chara braunii TaxID=69332 RepID=A0A388K312_CHABU|nr:hypothetical protein CBR_g41544 [Chara braunii]|eukprot:GBG64343.1 hypothetical protein CBR_g41544 [Chara braunii]
MLESLKRGRTSLELCVGNVAWVEKLVRAEQVEAFNVVTRTIVDSGFWDEVDRAIAVMEPVVKLLRLVDGPGATVSNEYFGMDEIVAQMRILDCLTEDEKLAVENILMDRETEDNNIPWKDNDLAKTEVEEWYKDWTRQVIDGRAAGAAATEVADEDDEDGPLVRTWQKNDAGDDLADEEDDIALLGSVQRTWHANTKPRKHRVPTPEPDEAGATRKGKSKEGGNQVAPPKRKRGRPPLSPAKKATNAAAKVAKKAAEDEEAAAKAAKGSGAADARPKRKHARRGMEDDDDNLQSSSSSSSSEERAQSSSSSSSSEEASEDEQSQEESGGEHESGEEAQ